MADIKYEIQKNLVVVQADNDWTLEVNLISWNGAVPKYDIRKWNSDHSRMAKGITLTENEFISLFSSANSMLKSLGVQPIEDVVITEDSGKELPFV